MLRPVLSRYVRTTLLVMIALGVLARPVLDRLGEMHQADHPLVADAGHHHHDGESDPDDAPGHDGSSGIHGVLHETSASSVLGALAHALTMPGPLDRTLPLPARHTSPVPTSPSTTPFRPPIA